MKKTMVKDIEIYYDDYDISRIDYIKRVIDNNYDLFLNSIGASKIISLVPTDNENIIYIEEFDKTFYELADATFNNEDIRNQFNNKDLMPALYIESLIRRSANNSDTLVKPNPNVSDNMFYAFLAYKYFGEFGSFDDFVSYLKDRKDTDEILKWFQKETRYDAYNYLLEVTANFLKQYDFDFLDNISDIVCMMFGQAINDVLFQKYSVEELPPVTVSEIDQLFYEFLQSIKAPIGWKQMYDDLKESSRITFEKQTDGIDSSMCYKDEDGIVRVLISTDGTIGDFCSLIHEFVHYVPMSQGEIETSKFSLLEFPSIYFEKMAALFLKNKGYQENVIDKVIEDRKKHNMYIYSSISTLFNDVSSFIKNGPILKSKKVEFWEKQFQDIQETKEKIFKICVDNGDAPDLSFLEKPVIDIEGVVDLECDSLIDGFVQNGLLIINGYQYLLDTFLADEVFEKTTNDPNMVTKMIELTEHLSQASLPTILIDFDIELMTSQSKKFPQKEKNQVLIKNMKDLKD